MHCRKTLKHPCRARVLRSPSLAPRLAADAMADVSSARVFARALADAGLGSLAADFERAGWTTHGDFAYSCGVPPGQADHDVRFVEEVVAKLTGDRESPLKPKLRRPFHESWTYQLADLRRTPACRRRSRDQRGCEGSPRAGVVARVATPWRLWRTPCRGGRDARRDARPPAGGSALEVGAVVVPGVAEVAAPGCAGVQTPCVGLRCDAPGCQERRPLPSGGGRTLRRLGRAHARRAGAATAPPGVFGPRLPLGAPWWRSAAPGPLGPEGPRGPATADPCQAGGGLRQAGAAAATLGRRPSRPGRPPKGGR